MPAARADLRQRRGRMEVMTRRARITILLTPLVLSLLAVAVTPPAAGADGLPVLGVDARPLQAPDERVAYVSRRAREGTALEVIDADSERRLRRVILPGRLSAPAVAYDATPSGLSADGRTLVLINPRRRFRGRVRSSRSWTRGRCASGGGSGCRVTSASTPSPPTPARCT
jgi:hypothetical protein